MRKILILYFSAQNPLISSISDHLYSFSRHSEGHCYYVNLAFRRIPGYLAKIKFDLIIFHTVFLSTRWTKPIFERVIKKARILKDHPAVKVAIPQDEFFYSEALCDFINEFGISHVFSAAPRSEWVKIYRKVDFERVKFHQVLTGYLEESTVGRIKSLEQRNSDRRIDVGYRAWRAEPWLGRQGMLKTQIAEVFAERAPREGLTTDISNRYEDRFLGDDWFKFLLRSKYTIGVEGGASLLDWDGSIRRKTQDYIAQHPRASFEEIEAACFSGRDNSLSLAVIAPRHLEACATKTCQVLVEGEYSGLLIADRHYIEIKKDFGNLDQVLKALKADTLREDIVENAFKDIVAKGHISYKCFVEAVLRSSLEGIPEQNLSSFRELLELLIWHWTRGSELICWCKVSIYSGVKELGKKVLPLLPKSLRLMVERWREILFLRMVGRS